MRAYEVLFETDQRSKIQKLQDVINHPNTEETVKVVAQNRLEILLANQPVEPVSRITIETNLTEDLLDVPYVLGKTAGQLYEALCALEPAPSCINFLRQGVIQMMVPPPFLGLTKPQYYQAISEAVGSCRGINSKLIHGEGYYFTISFL